VKLLSMSDGGDGFGELISRLLHAKRRVVRTVDAAHRPLAAIWWWEPKSRMAIIESARVVGLAMLPPARYHPFQLDTFGLGPVIREAFRLGAKRCLVGLGGSATNDGGFGFARALGWKFLDASGGMIAEWTRLDELSEIRAPRHRAGFDELCVAVDVQNPLLGPRGATRVYGAQKGLKSGDFRRAESCLRRLALVVRRQSGSECARIPGAGAAGGLGFGFLAFLGGRLEAGFASFARHSELARHLRRADLIITGEGRIDTSTLMGKGTDQLARLCRQSRKPCIAFAGCDALPPRMRHSFMKIHALANLATLKDACAEPALWLERLAARVASKWAGHSA